MMPLSFDPPPVLDYQVPVLLDPNDLFQFDQWDLTSNQVLIDYVCQLLYSKANANIFS